LDIPGPEGPLPSAGCSCWSQIGPNANPASHLISIIKGIGSILFLKNGLGKICRKNYKNHLRSDNYEVYTAVALCFPNTRNGQNKNFIGLPEKKKKILVLHQNDTYSNC
jgi:hypothetical protein